MRMLSPGVYFDDEKKDYHIDIPEMLAWAEWEDTPENRDRMTEVVSSAFKEVHPTKPIIEVE